MNKNNNALYLEMISTAAGYISTAISKYLPESTQKNFMLWVLTDENPYQESYLRMLGVAGSIELEIFLFKKIINVKTLKKLAGSIALLNTYFAFETLSDNIAIGLGDATKKDNSIYNVQRELLIGFNDAIIRKLRGDNNSVINLLKPFEPLTYKISAYQKCLMPKQMYEFAAEYQKLYPHASLEELEYCYFSILILNIHTCLNLVDSLQGHPLNTILKNSLIDRYEAVNEIIKSDHQITLEKLADLGAKSMLVMPSLAFCIGALDNIISHPSLHKAIENGSLIDNLYTAALLVRLLNDIGTNFLNIGAKDLQKLYLHFNEMLRHKEYNSIFEFLNNVSSANEFYNLMPRIRKDIQLGEFNICLDHLNISEDNVIALKEFFTRIKFFSMLYKKRKKFPNKISTLITNNFADKKINQIIVNFVKFHQAMYSKEYETKFGDYATTNVEAKKIHNTGANDGNADYFE